MTKEEILEAHFGSDYYLLKERGDLIRVLNAMEEYAKINTNLKTKKEIGMEICDVIQNADNESMELDDFTLGQLQDYCYGFQKVKDNVTIDINTQIEILKTVINRLMITFDNENDRMDYILDICNEYRKEVEKHYQ